MPPLLSIYDSDAASLQQSMDTGGMISTIVFGLAACLIGVITIWQGYRTWMVWRTYSVPAGFLNEHRLPTMDFEIGSFPPLHTIASTPHDIDEDRSAAGRDEELAAQNNEDGQYAATAGDGSPLPSTVPHGVPVAENLAGDEREPSEVVTRGEV